MSGETFPPEALTRAEGLARLQAAVPRLGRSYAMQRNTVAADDAKPTTAMLSPWLRRRLLTEEEVVAAVLQAHGPAEGEKFIQEVLWRTYFKGFLEQHPAAWTGYLEGLERARDAAGHSAALADARAGRTGIACFDAWAVELARTGWLHNHVRMWFASIWIFTLRLPWELGADLFARQLIDFDPASNTLSWRWVAGLHTRGKPYVARAENIARYTQGRFDPAGQLHEHPEPLREADAPPRAALPVSSAPPRGAFALLLHEDDLCPETLTLPHPPTRVAVLHAAAGEERQRRAGDVACQDGATRASAHFGDLAALLDDPADIRAWADGLPVVMPHAPTGPVASALAVQDGTRLIRPWDAALWPHCGRGYFQLKTWLTKDGGEFVNGLVSLGDRQAAS